MDKLNIWMAPFFALFSKDFYKKVLTAGLGKGFLYLVYFSLLLSTLFVGMVKVKVLPMIDSFVVWVAKEMPALQVTPEGIQMSVPSPKVMTHPDLGPVVIFDMNGEAAGLQGKLDSLVLVTAKKIFVKQRQGGVRTYDVVQMMAQQRGKIQTPLQITGESVERAYRSYKPWVLGVVFISLWFFFFVTQVLQGFISSLIGLVINLFRSPRLSYKPILNASFFALTASYLVGIFQMMVPFLRIIPTGFWFSVILTGIYLMLALKLTEEREKTA